MKIIKIKLEKDQVLHLRRGGKIDHFYEDGAIRVQIVGPDKKPKTNNK
jgi:hypothetical protein